MKILALADRPPKQSISGSIWELCLAEKIDLICTLGDLERFDLLELAQITDVPKIGVYGNHCSGQYMAELEIVNMHLRTATLNGVTFGGFEGCVRYKEGDAPMYTQEQAVELMKNMPRVDVFLSHAPPFGVNDEPDELTHQGFRALRNYLEMQKPDIWLHGHTYPAESELVTNFRGVRIEYVFGHRIIAI